MKNHLFRGVERNLFPEDLSSMPLNYYSISLLFDFSLLYQRHPYIQEREQSPEVLHDLAILHKQPEVVCSNDQEKSETEIEVKGSDNLPPLAVRSH